MAHVASLNKFNLISDLMFAAIFLRICISTDEAATHENYQTSLKGIVWGKSPTCLLAKS